MAVKAPTLNIPIRIRNRKKHHADRQQHRRHIFGCFLGGYFPTFARQYGYGGSATVQPAYNTGYQNTGLTEYVSFQQIRKIGDARNHHRSQPYTVRREVDARYQIVVGQHREDDTADGKELGSVIISSFFIRASSVNVCFSLVKSNTVTITIT